MNNDTVLDQGYHCIDNGGLNFVISENDDGNIHLCFDTQYNELPSTYATVTFWNKKHAIKGLKTLQKVIEKATQKLEYEDGN